MLGAWGSSCGQCRPPVVAPKTQFMTMSPSNLAAMLSSGLTLGWLVVMRSPDPLVQGTLIEVDKATVVLSRHGGDAQVPARGIVLFKDDFMSANHASVCRPRLGPAQGRFTVRDREDPGPSANGTVLNDRKLGRGELADLSDGDTILIGTTELLFRTLWLSPPAGR